MTYLDINDFVTKEVLPLINKNVQNFLDSEYSYIECEEDLDDLETAEVQEDLMNDIRKEIYNLIKECKNDYEFSEVDNKEIDDDELFNLVDSAFFDYKEMLMRKYADQFEREEYFDEYYSNDEDE